MAYILACLMAALSFLLNRVALRYIGAKAVITLSPALEEVAKTAPAFFLDADILLTHFIFGIIEAGYDWRTSQRHGAVAACLSVAGHSMFGLITVAIIAATSNLILALGGGIAVHLAWNVTLIRLTA